MLLVGSPVDIDPSGASPVALIIIGRMSAKAIRELGGAGLITAVPAGHAAWSQVGRQSKSSARTWASACVCFLGGVSSGGFALYW